MGGGKKITMSEKNEKQIEERAEEKEKIEKYKEMIGESKAVFLFSYGVREAGFEGKTIRPDSYKDLDIRGFMGGGHAVTIAAAELGQYFPDTKLVTSVYIDAKSSSGNPVRHNLFQVYAEELEKLGTPKEQIELERKSTNTITELIEMVKLARIRGWIDVAVLANEVHVPRIQVMFDKLEELVRKIYPDDSQFFEDWGYFRSLGGLNMHFLESENILVERDGRYSKIVEAVRNSPQYKKRKEAEEAGIQDILNDTYGKK